MFVNRLPSSIWFWIAVAGVAGLLVFWLAGWKASKAWKVVKLLGKFAVNLLALFLGLFGIQFKKILDGVEE